MPHKVCEDADTFGDGKALTNAAAGTRRECANCKSHVSDLGKMTMILRYKQASRGQRYVSVNESLWLEFRNVITPVDC